MNDEFAMNSQDDSEGQAQPLSDGIGLSIDALRQEISRVLNVNLPKDDPMLFVGVINNAFLNEYEKLLKKHDKLIQDYIGEQSKKYLNQLSQVSGDVSGIVDSLKDASIEKFRYEFAAFHDGLRNMRHSLFVLTAVMLISAAINVAVFVYGAKISSHEIAVLCGERSFIQEKQPTARTK